jgi:hypothetical protein
MVSISGDMPLLKFLENSTLFQGMVSISGDLPTLKKKFRKLHTFLKNGLNIE